MQEISKRNSRMWSRLGQRGTICGVALPEILESRDDCYVLTADLGTTSGLSRVMKEQPTRFVNVGIAEQNLIGVAAGIAFEGKTAFATTFATFLTMRCFEQIRHNLGYQKANVKLIGSSAGVAMGMFGNTHYSYEDIAIMRAIPNMTVVSPADATEAYLAVYHAMKIDGPVYIRLSGGQNEPIIYEEPYDFEIGKAHVLKKGEGVVLIAIGKMVSEALKVAQRLEQDGVNATVINMHTVKPLDTDILDAYMESDLIFTIEEHSVIGGLGSAVAEYLAKKRGRARQVFIGIEDAFVHPGDAVYVRRQNDLDEEGIYQRVKRELEERVL